MVIPQSLLEALATVPRIELHLNKHLRAAQVRHADSCQQGPYTTHVRHQTVLIRHNSYHREFISHHSSHHTQATHIKWSYRISYWHSYPERNLHTATRQTRMPGTHQHKIFESPGGAATPNDVYTARHQTRMPERHQRKMFASPTGTATPKTVYTQQDAKPACQQDIKANFLHLLMAQLPQPQFTRSKVPNLHARKTSAQHFRISYWHSYPEHSLHTARRQTRMPARHQRSIFTSPHGAATPTTVYTQRGAKPACQGDINAKFSHLLLAQLPRTHFTHTKAPNPHASKTSAQNFRNARKTSRQIFCVS